MNLPEEDGDAIPLNWEKTSILSKRASLHYRRFVEPEVEKRMSEVCKLSAQQRLQRLDSFLVESTVSKLEQRQIESRDELHWEMEQLKEQNKTIKKDNRELKQTCAKLEGRIEALERKFKTMARLLQS
uniref:BZIP domain-containing protein n=2 Tax=Bursaphelenchus xylophilus TaxID=6326 RepID=A0A1I7SHL2_BURXY